MQILNRRAFYGGAAIAVLGLIYASCGLILRRPFSVLVGFMFVLSGFLVLSRGTFRVAPSNKQSKQSKQ